MQGVAAQGVRAVKPLRTDTGRAEGALPQIAVGDEEVVALQQQQPCTFLEAER